MSKPDTVQMTVKSFISAPGRGVLASVRVEGGTVHVGDALQVHNSRHGATARVGQISLGSKLVKEARSGDEVLLLLENLGEADVHPGDRLLPGE